jgi:transcriptional regulator with XRE-family HTH domain
MDAVTRLNVTALGQRVETLRKASGFDQDDLAKHAYLSRAYISRLERGIVPSPKMTDLEQVASALGKSLVDLLHEPTGRTADLRRELTALMGPDKAAEIDNILTRIATMPESEQDLVLKVIRIQVDGWFRTRPPES